LTGSRPRAPALEPRLPQHQLAEGRVASIDRAVRKSTRPAPVVDTPSGTIRPAGSIDRAERRRRPERSRRRGFATTDGSATVANRPRTCVGFGVAARRVGRHRVHAGSGALSVADAAPLVELAAGAGRAARRVPQPALGRLISSRPGQYWPPRPSASWCCGSRGSSAGAPRSATLSSSGPRGGCAARPRTAPHRPGPGGRRAGRVGARDLRAVRRQARSTTTPSSPSCTLRGAEPARHEHGRRAGRAAVPLLGDDGVVGESTGSTGRRWCCAVSLLRSRTAGGSGRTTWPSSWCRGQATGERSTPASRAAWRGGPMPVTGREGLEVLRVLDAAVRRLHRDRGPPTLTLIASHRALRWRMGGAVRAGLRPLLPRRHGCWPPSARAPSTRRSPTASPPRTSGAPSAPTWRPPTY